MTPTPHGPASALLVEQSAGFWFVCLNRPEKRNALTDDLVAALSDALTRVAADTGARALVLCGAGGNFCAGADFSSLQELLDAPRPGREDPVARHNRRFGALLEQLSTLPVPTVAVVTGAAIGGGCGLAAACDRVIAVDGALFAMPEVTLGIAPAQIASFVARRTGTTRGRWLMLSGARLPAAAACDAGLVDVVTPAAALPAAVRAELTPLGAAEPLALRATKRIITRSTHGPLGEALDAAALEFAGLLRQGAVREGIAAARQRRAPAWQAAPPDMPAFP
jgi:isohexenylglutaconyl-CoA hydratase